MQVALRLLADRRDDGLGRVPAVQDADAADEVDVLAPVDVDDRRAPWACSTNDPLVATPRRDVALARLAQSRGLRAGRGLDGHASLPEVVRRVAARRRAVIATVPG